jgi:hypothetical protein
MRGYCIVVPRLHHKLPSIPPTLPYNGELALQYLEINRHIRRMEQVSLHLLFSHTAKPRASSTTPGLSRPATRQPVSDANGTTTPLNEATKRVRLE